MEAFPAALWRELDAAPDRTLFQTRPWLDFVARTQKSEPVFGILTVGELRVACFTGFIVRKAGLKILGSPFRGWTTPYMGFNIVGDLSRAAAVAAVRDHAFNRLGCVHFELMDRSITRQEAEAAGFCFNVFPTYQVDLSRTENEILAAMSHGRRQAIRKVNKDKQLTVEEATDSSFCGEYYSQLQEVFAKQGFSPTYTLDRVKALVDCLLPSGHLLLLRARDRCGNCIATGIFPAFNGLMHAWGLASYPASYKLSPNESIQWHAMRYWKQRGVLRYDMGGGGSYKAQYGGERLEIPWISESKGHLIKLLRLAAYRAYKLSRKLRRFAGHRSAYQGCREKPPTSRG